MLENGFYFLLCRQAPIESTCCQDYMDGQPVFVSIGAVLCLAVSGVLTGSIARPVQTLDEAMEKVKREI